MYAHVENGIVDYRGALPKTWRNISGLNTMAGNDEYLAPLGWLPYVEVPVVIGENEVPDGEDTVIEATRVVSTAKKRKLTAPEIADNVKELARREIDRLEKLETPRSLAEAILDPSAGRGWLTDNRAAIATERAKLR